MHSRSASIYLLINLFHYNSEKCSVVLHIVPSVSIFTLRSSNKTEWRAVMGSVKFYSLFLFNLNLKPRIVHWPQPPHTHRNLPPITHPKTVFLCDLSVCIIDSSEGTPVALHYRFAELSTISEIPEILNSS